MGAAVAAIQVKLAGERDGSLQVSTKILREDSELEWKAICTYSIQWEVFSV